MTPLEKARSLLGVPWRHQGRDPAKGIDCAGLLIYAFEVTGQTPSYGRDPHHGLMDATIQRFLGPPVDGPMQPGDAVSMAYAGDVRHCGIIGDHPDGGLSLIHTDSIVGCVTEHRLDAKWLRRIRRVYRQ